MEIVFDDAHAGDDFITVKAKIPAVFGIPAKVLIHALKIRLCRNTPFAVEPFRSVVLKLRHFS